MMGFFEQVFSFLTTSPGNLIYHLALAFAIVAAIQAVAMTQAGESSPQSRRKLIGLSALLLSQLVLFLIGALAWQGLVNLHISLPVLDRAISTFCLIWIIWLWAFPARQRPADIANGVFILLSVILFIITYIDWRNANPLIAFNGSWQDLSWQIYSVFIAGLGTLVLLLWRPRGWGTGLAVISLNLLGHLFHFMWTPTGGDFSGIVRLAQLCAYPLLPLLARSTPVLPAEKKENNDKATSILDNPHLKDARVLTSWINLANQNQGEKIYPAAARAIAQTMQAEICYLIKLPADGNELIFVGGYDNLREQDLPRISLKKIQVPTLADALQSQQPWRVNAEDPLFTELNPLMELIRQERVGSALLLPLADEQENWGGALLMNPYLSQDWDLEDASYLQIAFKALPQIFRQSEQHTQLAESQNLTVENLETTRTQLEQQQQENQKLLIELESLRRASDMDALLTLQREAEELIKTLQAENERLRAQLSQPAQPTGNEKKIEPQENLEKEFRQTLEEVAHLQNALSSANMKILTLERQTKRSAALLSRQHQLLADIIPQLQQDLSFIASQNEMLLSEKDETLASTQNKVLEDIRESTERMSKLLDDLMSLTVLQDLSFASNSDSLKESADINEALDQAVASIATSLQEKNITLNLELPENLPLLQINGDCLQQILFFLLENAAVVTPSEGVINLRASIKRDEPEQEYFLFQVMDQGGGITTEDLPLIFSQQRHINQPPISGIGDTGCRLIFAKMLTETHGGKMWLESRLGSSSTVYVLLPVQSDQVK